MDREDIFWTVLIHNANTNVNKVGWARAMNGLKDLMVSRYKNKDPFVLLEH